MAKILVALVLVGCVLAEPPVNRGYLPPQARFLAPSQQYGAPTPDIARFSAPSAEYDAPAEQPSRLSAPSEQYKAPARFSAQAQQYGAPDSPAVPDEAARFSAPSREYEAPVESVHAAPDSARFSERISAPAEEYGAPALSIRADSGPARFSTGHTSSYGAPAGPYADSRARFAEDDLSGPAHYEFAYAVEDVESGASFGHQESRQDESAKGEYRVLLPDGRTQIVEYEADQEGYRPQIRYEEAQGPYSAAQRSQEGPY